MAYELKEGSGVMFKDHRKQNERAPDWRGECLINGKPVEVAAWEKDGRKGMFLSFSIKPKRDRQPQQQGEPRQAPAAHPDDGETVPF